MRSYLSIRNPNTIIVCFFVLLFFRYFVGIGFENTYLNEFFALFLFSLPIYLFYLLFKAESANKFVRIILIIFFGFCALLSFAFIFLGIVGVYTTAHNGGVDPSFEIVRTLDASSTKVVVYRSNGGAMTSFGIVVSAEKTILPGVYIKHDLLSVDGADDVNMSLVSSDSIKIDSINFTSPEYRAQYMSENPQVRDGSVIRVN